MNALQVSVARRAGRARRRRRAKRVPRPPLHLVGPGLLRRLAGDVCARRNARRDPRGRRSRRARRRAVAARRHRGGRHPARAGSLPARRTPCEAPREAQALGLAGPGLVYTATVHEATRPRADGRPGLFAFKGGVMAQVEERGRATSEPAERQRVLDEVKDQGVKFIHLWFTDIEGHLKSFSITPAELEGALDDGMGFDGSSITGFNAIEESDMVAIPDPATFRIMPAQGERKVGRMICDIVRPDGEPY